MFHFMQLVSDKIALSVIKFMMFENVESLSCN